MYTKQAAGSGGKPNSKAETLHVEKKRKRRTWGGCEGRIFFDPKHSVFINDQNVSVYK
jgi:hypothetical protein